MTGHVRQKHKINISQRRIGLALSATTPQYHSRRRSDTARLTNPIPYRADYFGHKMHIDQNEKLVMYGVTHVVAIDGHSRFILAGSTMPLKNNGKIYSEVYRLVVFNYSHHYMNLSGMGVRNTRNCLRSIQDQGK